jgi:hypothetical protein
MHNGIKTGWHCEAQQIVKKRTAQPDRQYVFLEHFGGPT